MIRLSIPKLLFLLLLKFQLILGLTQSEFDMELYNEINRVRQQRGLRTIPFSPQLATVAQAHTRDLSRFRKGDRNGNCNLHSWYQPAPNVPGCCYDEVNPRAECMWDKPSQLTNYEESGFEIAYNSNVPNEQLTSDLARKIIQAFLNSPPHRAVILSEGIWSGEPWLALGTANFGGFTVAWFGKALDSSRPAPPSSSSVRPTATPLPPVSSITNTIRPTGLPTSGIPTLTPNPTSPPRQNPTQPPSQPPSQPTSTPSSESSANPREIPSQTSSSVAPVDPEVPSSYKPPQETYTIPTSSAQPPNLRTKCKAHAS